MKFFLELGSCCGGVTVTLAAESAVTLLKKTATNRCAKANSSAHWKSALPVVSEDSVVSDLGDEKIKWTVRPAKKAKLTAVARSPEHSDKYRCE